MGVSPNSPEPDKMLFFWSKDRLRLSKWISSVEKTLWRHSPFRNQDSTQEGLTLWRERILFSVLAAGNGLAILALIPSVFMAFQRRSLASRRSRYLRCPRERLPVDDRPHRPAHENRRGPSDHISDWNCRYHPGRFLSGGPAWLFCFAVLSGVLLGLRAALIAILHNATALFVLWWLSSREWQAVLRNPSELHVR